MLIVGQIDLEIYKCVSDDIITTEVIITEERIEHIKNRHPNDYESYSQYMNSIIEDPDYIIEDNNPDSAILLKEITEGNERFQLVIRLSTSKNNREWKNSVITFLKISERTWNKYLRNKKILYKRDE